MNVAVTCIQLIRDLDQHRPVLEGAGLSVTVPVIAGQHLEGDELVAAVDGLRRGDRRRRPLYCRGTGAL